MSAFHPSNAIVNKDSTVDLSASPLSDEQRQVLRQALGSTVTYVWGPPGTGKTHLIAHLIAALLSSKQRVLLTSHTHVAVDQALYETVKYENTHAQYASSDGPVEFMRHTSCPNCGFSWNEHPQSGECPLHSELNQTRSRSKGPLANDPLIAEGKILRLGRTQDPKVGTDFRFEDVVARRSGQISGDLAKAQHELQHLTADRDSLTDQLREWDQLDALKRQLEQTDVSAREARGRLSRAESELKARQQSVSRCEIDLGSLQAAWFFREVRERNTRRRLERCETDFEKARQEYALAFDAVQQAEQTYEHASRAVQLQEGCCAGLRQRTEITARLSTLNPRIADVETSIQKLELDIASLAKAVLSDAVAVFCTLTKNYIGRELDAESFDAVIVDEISMALPPLVLLAAARATSRLILVGDFHQLPPIVRSDSEISSVRLRQDIFHLAGVVAGNSRITSESPVLARLSTQRRMVPEIADVARHLVYSSHLKDHDAVFDRECPGWLSFLPDSPLVVVDTADLHCWSGKQPGSLSRFNFYSAQLATELASMAAADCPKPAEGEPPEIGIVTPYAAQRRLLNRHLMAMQLESWVAAGTVHTFQGKEAKFIIFDSVLDEPYYSARLCDPRNLGEILRELNVAVTRSKFKFAFIGSSEWLNKHASPASALGKLWMYLQNNAEFVPAADLVESGFGQRVLERDSSETWQLPLSRDNDRVHQVLDENTFFEYFLCDLRTCSQNIFGLVPYFGEYRWPRIEPSLSAALERSVEVTLVTPPLAEAANRAYVEAAIRHLRELGAVVICASGLHGKDIIIDERICYTGSLNWASHRGRLEIMHRTVNEQLAALMLKYLQARFIREAAVFEDGTARLCPFCHKATQVVNQRRQHGPWDFQAMKVGCSNPECQQYLRSIDERPPFRVTPTCAQDGQTKLRRVRRGRGEAWECPKHPRAEREKVVPGDPP